MKISLLLTAVLFIGAFAADYQPFQKAKPIVILTYGGPAAKDIRSVGRSYAADLTNNEDFTTYAGDIYDLVDQYVNVPDGEDPQWNEFVNGLKDDYLAPIVMVLGGIVLAILLFIGFCCTPICCCCCNKTQKQTSTMSMWRMVWGALLIVLLGANIAGLAILFVSGTEMLSLGEATDDTFDSMSKGVTGYLDDTNAQLETLISDDGQLKTFMDQLTPLFDDALENAVSSIQADPTLKGHVDKIVGSLNGLDTDITTAGTDLDDLIDKVDTLKASLTTIQTGLTTCKAKIDQCDADHTNACNDAGILSSNFDVTFDPATIDTSDLTTARTSVTDMSSFGTNPARTLAEWATEVQTEWDGMLPTVKEEFATTLAAYTDTLNNAETEFKKNIQENAIDQLTSAKTDVEEQFTIAKGDFNAYQKALKDAVLMKGAEPQSDDDVILLEGFLKYIVFGVFVLVCVLLGLIILTVVVGLLATIFGCCKADDSVIPTERSTGCCGNLLMCTSYCSVFLCAVATLTAALFLPTMLGYEGLCHQYNNDNLLTGIDDLLLKFMDDYKGLDVLIQENLKLPAPVNAQDLMDSCKAEETFFGALDLSKTDEIAGFSIQGTIDKVDAEIDRFTPDIAGTTFDLELMSADDKAVLNDNKASLKPAGYADIKTKVEGTSVNAAGLNIADVQTDIGNLPGPVQTTLQDCTDLLDGIATQISEIDTTEKGEVVAAIEKVSATADGAIVNIGLFIEGIDDLAKDESTDIIKAKVSEQVTITKESAKTIIAEFLNFVYEQLKTTLGSCQPVAAAYYSIMNYSCDGIFIHITLIYLSLSLIGISLLFYMCISRCLARYFIKYGRLHPDDTMAMGDGWTKDHGMTSVGAGNKVGPHPGYYAQTKL